MKRFDEFVNEGVRDKMIPKPNSKEMDNAYSRLVDQISDILVSDYGYRRPRADSWAIDHMEHIAEMISDGGTEMSVDDAIMSILSDYEDAELL
jgi:hypothetical protein